LNQIIKDLKHGAKRQATKFAENRRFSGPERGDMLATEELHFWMVQVFR